MNTFQLAQVLAKDPFTKGSFAGIYACDQLSSIEINKYPKSFAVNTDPMELAGNPLDCDILQRTNERRIFLLLWKASDSL